MDGFERIEAILAKIQDAHKIWPEWFWPCCPECGDGCAADACKVMRCWNRQCYSQMIDIEPVYKFDPILNETAAEAWHGTETDPRNAHHLWRILCHVDERRSPIITEYVFLNTPDLLIKEPIVDDDFCDAAIRALCLALGVE